MPKHNPKVVFDAEGNMFTVKGFTRNLQGAVSGFYLQGERGAKEIPLSEYKFFKTSRRRK
jgi:hypothetical protein